MSVKQQLITKLLAEEDRLAADLYSVRSHLRDLQGRGSGPLPFWAKDLARRLGIS